MKISVTHILLILIVGVAGVFRLVYLDAIPPGVNRDEASIGYTAYSLLKTGKDEYARFLPLSFESFGDWKLPGYIYLAVPFIAVFGMTEFAVRLPSALAGTLTVAVLFFLVKELFQKRQALSVKREDKGFHIFLPRSYVLPLTSSLLLALSPWHIHLSRVASEANLAVFVSTLAILFFFKAINTRPRLFPISFFLFGLTLYIYHGNHITTTLLVAGLFFIYRRTLFKSKYALIGLGVFLLVILPILAITLGGADKTKISGIGIFGNPGTVHEKIELPRLEHADPNNFLSQIMHNRIVYGAQTFAQNYLNAFSPEFLFFKGGTNHAHNIENFGNMYVIEAPFLLLGLYYVLKNRRNPMYLFLLYWGAISPLAASITKDAPHTTRMFALYPLPAIIASLGIWQIITAITRAQGKKIAALLIVGLYSANVLVYIDRYFIHFPKNEAMHWGYPYKLLAAYLSGEERKEKKVIISHPEYSPYIFLLFYTSYDPKTYQKNASRYPKTEDAFSHVWSFDRYEFKTIDWGGDLRTDTVVVGITEETPEFIKNTSPAEHIVLLPNGTPYLTVVQP